MDDVDRIAPRSISATERLREAILNGELQPGERINEVHISRDLGVSRTPTRAALHALAAEGLVDYAHNRGFTVREFPLQAVMDAYQIRATLEGLACRLAAERGLEANHDHHGPCRLFPLFRAAAVRAGREFDIGKIRQHDRRTERAHGQHRAAGAV